MNLNEMLRFRTLLTFPVVVLVAIGCDQSKSPNAPQPPGPQPVETIRIERVKDAEAVLAQLGRTSWIFKHRGGELTAEFTIYHRPEGKNDTESVIFKALGDEAVWWYSQSDNDRTRGKEEGYLIVAIPDSYKQGAGEVTFSFSLSSAHTKRTASADEIYPKSVFSHSGWSWHSEPSDKPVELTPGETKILVDWTHRLSSRDSETPFDEGECLRYVLTVTALKKGQLPERDNEKDNE